MKNNLKHYPGQRWKNKNIKITVFSIFSDIAVLTQNSTAYNKSNSILF